MANDWYVRVMGDVVGPLAPAGLLQLARTMRITPDDEVREGPDGKWTSAENVRGLFSPAVQPGLTIADVIRRTAAKASRLVHHRGK